MYIGFLPLSHQSLPRFTFVFLWRLLKLLLFLACADLTVKFFRESLKTPDGIHYEKDFDICRKRYAWKRPIFGMMREIDKALQFHELPFGLNGSVLAAFDILQLIPEQEMPKSLSSLHCKKCVIVGNGYSLHKQRLGTFIDSHNVIIRLNNAPLRGYEEDVGQRTTIRFFYPESAVTDPLENNDKDTLFVLIPFKLLDFVWVKEILQKKKNKTVEGFWQPVPTEWKGNASYLRIINPYVTYQATYKYLQLAKRPKKFSTTGIIAVNFALHLCQEVNIVGFGFPEIHDNMTPVHYYGTERLTRKLPHNFTAEREWLLKLREREFLSDVLFPPSSWVWGPRPQW